MCEFDGKGEVGDATVVTTGERSVARDARGLIAVRDGVKLLGSSLIYRTMPLFYAYSERGRLPRFRS